MRDLPTGAVSMLFSDIEGSTLLLNRLGPRYVDALAGQRRVLRAAWAAHEGIEIGTEGDSFFVVFRTAGEAVSAAARAQRDLEQHRWPAGEHVRVRMGIHTGAPQVHEENYVGMDVHRAARIASSAHGGQVVVSSVTAELAGTRLPHGVALQDLGTYRLKDLPAPEHLFQLMIDGLPSDFPALKTIGTASSLPAPSTPLVGRDDHVAALMGLVRSPEVRLVTLMGPGGSGKTRLAIAVAQQAGPWFEDGIFYVPLAPVRSAEVMWTSIADVLDVPARNRTPSGVLDYLAHRRALLVLDNLEQVSEADDIVDRLLAAAPRLAVMTTSRRALSLVGEHRYPVPPLSLPTDSTLAAAQAAAAVQLFAQRARSVRPDFRLGADNIADVVAICRRLDGLPLAVELAASRVRLLNPAALLDRLGNSLDLASTSRRGPARQRTLRDTIGWSYELLSPAQQAFFRRLAPFAGGADMGAVAAVAAVPVAPTDDADAFDALDMVADLSDASLITITDGPDGAPRVGLLETVRAYARDQLRVAGEAGAVRSAHAHHYLQVAERLEALRGMQHLEARGLADSELDNFREALRWTLPRTLDEPTESTQIPTGVGLCSALGWLWYIGGYLAEGRSWFERAIERAGDSTSPELVGCIAGLANLLIPQGEIEVARDVAVRGVGMARALGDRWRLAFALGVLGTAELQLGDVSAARRSLWEALELHRGLGDRGKVAAALGNLAGVEELMGDLERAEALTLESLAILQELGNDHEVAVQRQNLASLYTTAGRIEEARRLADDLIEPVLQLRSPNLTLAFADTYMNILIRLGEPVRAAHLLGAEEAMRERYAMPNPFQEEELAATWEMVRHMISAPDWEHHRRLGREQQVEDLLAPFESTAERQVAKGHKEADFSAPA